MFRVSAQQRNIVRAISTARREAGLSSRALSLKLKEHHSYLSRIERLERSVTVDEFMAIARVIGVDPVDLFRKAMG